MDEMRQIIQRVLLDLYKTCNLNYSFKYASERIAQALREAGFEQVRRCSITKNPCGTDTWAEGQPCPCKNCQE